MPQESPRIFVVDDDRAVLSLVGTSVSCLEVLRALRSARPTCEAVLTTGYQSVDAAVEALRQSLGCPDTPALPPPSSTVVPAPLVEVERDHILRTLEVVHGNKAVAARLLGMSRRALYRLLERHGLHHRVQAPRHSLVPPAVSDRVT